MDNLLHEVAPGVFAWVQPDGSWWINNAGAVVADGEAVVIDTCATARRTERFLAALTEASGGADIRTAVNTHVHGDHTYGNSLLPSSTVIVGHRHMREALRNDRLLDNCPPFWSPVPDWGPVSLRLPDIAISGPATVWASSRPIELLHPGGPAHTDGDLAAWLPEDGVLFTGDLIFSGLTPLVFMGSLTGALAAVDLLAALEPAVVVPGHGPVLTGPSIARVFEEHRRYYRWILALADEGLTAGRTPLEVARRADLGEFAGWADAERVVLNLHRAFAERTGAELSVPAAFNDAIAWLGHPLPTAV